jgi:hypothetical protein
LKGVILKKVLLIVAVITFSILPVSASCWNATDRVPTVGMMIVKRNSLPPSIQFEIVNSTPDNKYAIATNKIQIGLSDLEYASNDSEVAYLVSKELGEVIVKNLIPDCKTIDNNDIEAMSIDLMINGGYNPLASISLVTKIPQNSIENKAHRANKFTNYNTAEYLYNYINFNYPSKIIRGYNSDAYKNFVTSIQPELVERKCSKRKNKKFIKAQTKINNNRLKNLAKYNPAISKLSLWDLTPELLQSITEPEEQ